ncbi:hypothetical protein [Nocardia gipuzkoensis]
MAGPEIRGKSSLPTRAEAVFVPGRAHLDGHIEQVMRCADVIFDAEDVEARWSLAEAIDKWRP